jgi:hypothetical protein
MSLNSPSVKGLAASPWHYWEVVKPLGGGTCLEEGRPLGVPLKGVLGPRPFPVFLFCIPTDMSDGASSTVCSCPGEPCCYMNKATGPLKLQAKVNISAL